ncbi:MAG: RyR domain-containing protein, partial [candidate division WOR-3 bacterium]
MKRIKDWLKFNQWQIFIVIFFFTIGLSVWGILRYSLLWAHEKFSFWTTLYRIFQLFVVEYGEVPITVPLPLRIARVLAPALAAYAAIKALLMIFYEQFRLLWISLPFNKRHIIVCGLHQKGFHLTKKLREKGERVVVIEKDAENDLIKPTKDEGAIVLIGDATSEEMLKKAKVEKARHLIAVCKEDETNIAVIQCAKKLIKKRPRNLLTCAAHIYDTRLRQELSLQEFERKEEKSSCFFDFFNIFQIGARELLNKYPFFKITKGEKKLLAEEIIVLGCGKMAESLIELLVRKWRNEFWEEGKLLRILIVGKDATLLRGRLRIRHPRIIKFCELIAHPLDFLAPDFELEFPSLIRKESLIYVCLEKGAESISIGMGIKRILKQKLDEKIPKIIAVVDHNGSFEFGETFALLDNVCLPENILDGSIETIARNFHESNRERVLKNGTSVKRKSLKPWDELDEEYKNSSREAAKYISERLKKIGCCLYPLTSLDAEFFEFTHKEIEELARLEHERFFTERTKKGWRCGPYEEGEKFNPYLKEWEEFTQEEKEYDYEMVRKLPKILSQAGFEIVRIYYEHVAKALYQEHTRNENFSIGKWLPLRVEWNDLGDAGWNWYREKANKLIQNLRNLCYTLKSVEGNIENSLNEDEIELFCQMENENWERMERTEKDKQKENVETFLRILADCGWKIEYDRDELIARAFHEHWCAERNKMGERDPFLVPWHQLPEYKKDGNREAAYHIIIKLKAIGCAIRQRQDPNAPLFKFTKEEVEIMAKMEHERWMEEQIDKGWRYGPGPKDVNRKTNPNLLRWEELPKDIKEKFNRKPVRKIPEILSKV